MVLYYILAAVVIVSLMSFIGILALSIKKKTLQKSFFPMIGFAAGAMLGAAFFDLLPEAIEYEIPNTFVYVLLGILFFFATEKFIFWHHHHSKSEIHSFTYMNLLGDGIHNFLDGVVITASFMHSINLGLVTTLAILLHEIPQEISDFSILIYGGFSKIKAMLFNFLSALTSVVGALLAYLYFSSVQNIVPYLMLFAAGGFMYISCTDLFPEMKKESDFKSSAKQLIAILIGIIVILFVSKIVPV